LKREFYSNGKLLISGEYLVLDGATALAIPAKFGQSLEVIPSEKEGIVWKSFDENGNIWFEDRFSVSETDPSISSGIIHDKQGDTLLKILQQAKKMNSGFLTDRKGWKVTTKLNFPMNWGLGTSSTLIHNIAQWAGVDSFVLLADSFGGSGYDIAAARSGTPILYKTMNGNPFIEPVEILWNFTDKLFFVHLNKKQDSKDGILRYRKAKASIEQLSTVSAISHSLLATESLGDFELLLQKHENIISKIIQLPAIKDRLFFDYPNTIKSLGAWGGDFILVTGNENEMEYFRKKGYHTIIPFTDMLL
jgi:hypothetical protein